MLNLLVFSTTILLPLAVLGHSAMSIGSLVLVFYELPFGWALALCIWSIALAANGYKLMALANSWSGEQRRWSVNPVAGATLGSCLLLVGSVWFALSGAASDVSQWWALTLPFGLAVVSMVQAAMWQFLNVVNPAGKE